jgi:hypothetical protein
MAKTKDMEESEWEIRRQERKGAYIYMMECALDFATINNIRPSLEEFLEDAQEIYRATFEYEEGQKEDQ